jgi:hypothetical protein
MKQKNLKKLPKYKYILYYYLIFTQYLPNKINIKPRINYKIKAPCINIRTQIYSSQINIEKYLLRHNYKFEVLDTHNNEINKKINR